MTSTTLLSRLCFTVPGAQGFQCPCGFRRMKVCLKLFQTLSKKGKKKQKNKLCGKLVGRCQESESLNHLIIMIIIGID